MFDVLARFKRNLADRYHIEATVGGSRTAVVYRARDLGLGRQVAVKVLRGEWADAVGRKRFLSEISLAEPLFHPWILPLYEFGEAGGFLYLVMPLVTAPTLRGRLDERGPFPVEEAVGIALEVAEALHFAHRMALVHRNVRPENIFFQESHALVADMGIGSAVAAATAGRGAPPPAFLSPEQAAGGGVDGRSDLFALGCVLYEMLAGEAAFPGRADRMAGKTRFTHSPPPVTAARPSVPPKIAAVVSRLLQAPPEARYASGAEVIDALCPPALTPPSRKRRKARGEPHPDPRARNARAEPDDGGLDNETSKQATRSTVDALRQIARTLGVPPEDFVDTGEEAALRDRALAGLPRVPPVTDTVAFADTILRYRSSDAWVRHRRADPQQVASALEALREVAGFLKDPVGSFFWEGLTDRAPKLAQDFVVAVWMMTHNEDYAGGVEAVRRLLRGLSGAISGLRAEIPPDLESFASRTRSLGRSLRYAEYRPIPLRDEFQRTLLWMSALGALPIDLSHPEDLDACGRRTGNHLFFRAILWTALVESFLRCPSLSELRLEPHSEPNAFVVLIHFVQQSSYPEIFLRPFTPFPRAVGPIVEPCVGPRAGRVLLLIRVYER